MIHQRFLLSVIFLVTFTTTWSQETSAILDKILLPTRFDFQNKENEYRLSSIIKNELEKKGYQVFYADGKIKVDFSERCQFAVVDLIKEKSSLKTVFVMVFKDCQGKLLFQSPKGISSIKEFEKSYHEALMKCLSEVPESSLFGITSGGVAVENTMIPQIPFEKNLRELDVSGIQLYAQKVAFGYQLVDTTPKILFKATKTSIPNAYLVTGLKQGLLTIVEDQWFLEYQENDTTVKVLLLVKD